MAFGPPDRVDELVREPELGFDPVDTGKRVQMLRVAILTAALTHDVSDSAFAGGVKQDGKYITASINSGVNVVTNAGFVAADVGKTIFIPGAGAAGADLITTITAVTPGVSATIAVAASTTVTNVEVLYGTDDSAAWQAAADTFGSLESRGGIMTVTAPPPGANERLVSVLVTQVNFTNLRGGKVIGTADGGVAFPVLAYLPNTGSAFRINSCFNFTHEGISFWSEATDASAVNLVQYDTVGSDNMNTRLVRCNFLCNVPNPPKINSFVKWNKMIFSSIKGCSFGPTFNGASIELGPSYVNACSIDEQCVFQGYRDAIRITSTDCEVLDISNNTFEGGYAGQAGCIVGKSGNLCYRLSIRDNWTGDFSLGGRGFIEGVNAHIGGADVVGNDIQGMGAPFGVRIQTTQQGGGGLNEKQQVVVVADSGQYTLTFEGQTTAGINFDATGSALQTALENLSNIAPGDVVVTEDLVTNPAGFGYRIYDVEFTGALANSNRTEMTATNTTLDGSGAIFRKLSGGLWDIHNNYIAGSGIRLLDNTGNGNPSIHFHDNTPGVTEFVAHTASTYFQNAPWTANDNLFQGGTENIPENTRTKKSHRLETGATYTFQLRDQGTYVRTQQNATPVTWTVPAKSTIANGAGFAIGTEIYLKQDGTGQITIAGGATVVVPNGFNSKLRRVGSQATLRYIDHINDVWELIGDLEPNQPLLSIASAAALSVSDDGFGPEKYVQVTGTADITSITTKPRGTILNLYFTGTAATNGLTDGGTLLLAGNFVYTPNDTITLQSDGTNWIEKGRSVN